VIHTQPMECKVIVQAQMPSSFERKREKKLFALGEGWLSKQEQ